MVIWVAGIYSTSQLVVTAVYRPESMYDVAYGHSGHFSMLPARHHRLLLALGPFVGARGAGFRRPPATFKPLEVKIAIVADGRNLAFTRPLQEHLR